MTPDVDKSKQQDDNLSNASSESNGERRSSSIASAFMGILAGEGLELDMQEYEAIDSYEAAEASQLSFETGEVIMVLDKMEDGKLTVGIIVTFSCCIQLR